VWILSPIPFTFIILCFYTVVNLVLFTTLVGHSDIWVGYTCTLSLLLVVSIYFVKKSEVVKYPLERNKWLLTLPFFIYFCVEAYLRYPSHIFWLDEYTQVIRSISDPGIGSTVEQQPLLGYLVSSALYHLKIATIPLMRLGSFIPTLICLLIGFLVGFQQKLRWPYFILVGLFFCTNSSIKFSSLEGRPVALGVMHLALFLWNYFNYIEKPNKSSLFFTFISCLLFLMSLGMQPVVLGVMMAMISLTLWMVSKQKSYLYLVFAIGAAGIAFLPFQYSIYETAASFHKFKAGSDLTSVDWFNQFSQFSYLSFFESDSYYPLIAYLLGIVTLIIWHSLKRKNYLGIHSIVTVYLFLFLSPVLLDFLFIRYINWTFQPWYKTCFLVGANIFFFAVISRKVLPKAFEYTNVAIISLLLIISSKPGVYHGTVISRTNWIQIKSDLDIKFGNSKWAAYVTGPCHVWVPSQWCMNLYVGAELLQDYPGQLNMSLNSVSPYHAYSSSDNGLIKDYFHPRAEPIHLVVLVLDNQLAEGDLRKSTKNDQRNSVLHGHGYMAIYNNKAATTDAAVLSLLEELTEILPAKATYFYPYELLAKIYARRGDRDQADLWLRKLHALDELIGIKQKMPNLKNRISDIETFISNQGK